jgi:predicted nuclease with TOPRIM domain
MYIKENTNLKTQLEDIKTTLNINKELLFKYISKSNKSLDNKNVMKELRDENNRLTEKLDKIYMEKTEVEKKVI